MPIQKRLEVQVITHRARPVFDHRLPIPAEDQPPVPQHPILQGQRRRVQHDDVHIIRAEDPHQAADDLQTQIKSLLTRAGLAQQHRDIDVGQGAGFPARVRPEKVGKHHLVERREVLFSCRQRYIHPDPIVTPPITPRKTVSPRKICSTKQPPILHPIVQRIVPPADHEH